MRRKYYYYCNTQALDVNTRSSLHLVATLLSPEQYEEFCKAKQLDFSDYHELTRSKAVLMFGRRVVDFAIRRIKAYHGI